MRKYWYPVAGLGALIGIVASFWDTIDYQLLLKNSHIALSCNLNSAFSCSTVLSSWQSKVFGFPNSMMCLVFFSLILGFAITGPGNKVIRKTRYLIHGLAVFFLGFGAWFLEQSIFSIRAICILCLFCYGGVILINAALLRLNYDDLPLHSAAHDKLAKFFKSGTDIFVWILYALVIGFIILFRFK
jgi:uncharacterized membrane protein